MDGKRPTAREICGNRRIYHGRTAREDQTETATGVGRRSAFDQGGYDVDNIYDLDTIHASQYNFQTDIKLILSYHKYHD